MNINQMRAAVRSGPPKQPTRENPGALVKTLMDVAASKGENPNVAELAVDLVMNLAAALDRLSWQAETHAYNSMREMVRRQGLVL